MSSDKCTSEICANVQVLLEKYKDYTIDLQMFKTPTLPDQVTLTLPDSKKQCDYYVCYDQANCEKLDQVGTFTPSLHNQESCGGQEQLIEKKCNDDVTIKYQASTEQNDCYTEDTYCQTGQILHDYWKTLKSTCLDEQEQYKTEPSDLDAQTQTIKYTNVTNCDTAFNNKQTRLSFTCNGKGNI